MSQLALPLDFRRNSDPGRIVIGNANAHIVEALRDPSAWPFHTAVLTGPPRSGKSLLGRWFAAQEAGETVERADMGDEAELFHRWNRAQEDHVPLLLIPDQENWDIALPDLRSRIGGSLQLRVEAPDDEMMAALIESHANRRGLALGDGVLTYLVPRTPRSFAEIETLVIQIDQLSMERKAPVNLSICRTALEITRRQEQANLQ